MKKNKIYDTNFVLTALLKSITIKEFTSLTGIHFHGNRDKRSFYEKFGVNLTEIINNNKTVYDIIQRQQFENLIFMCDNCGEYYRNGDRLVENKSGRHFLF